MIDDAIHYLFCYTSNQNVKFQKSFKQKSFGDRQTLKWNVACRTMVHIC